MAGSKDEVKVKAKKSGKPATTAGGEPRLPKKLYETELFRLQAELVKLQEWVRAERRPHRGDLRGPGRGRQGQHDQAGHRST